MNTQYSVITLKIPTGVYMGIVANDEVITVTKFEKNSKKIEKTAKKYEKRMIFQ